MCFRDNNRQVTCAWQRTTGQSNLTKAAYSPQKPIASFPEIVFVVVIHIYHNRSKNFDKKTNRRQKFTDEENRTARKSHCESVERHQQCDSSRAVSQHVCRATTTTTTTSVSSLSRHSRSDALECTPVTSLFGRPAGRTRRAITRILCYAMRLKTNRGETTFFEVKNSKLEPKLTRLKFDASALNFS